MDDDTQLVKAALAGSPSAGETLYARHWDGARRTAYAVCQRDALADDVAQEAMIRAFSSLASWEPRAPFGAWLRRIVVNQAINALRVERRLVPLSDDETAAVEDSPADPDLLAAVRALPVDRRVAVTLRYGLDLTPAEIADALDVPVGTVNSRLARGLKNLRASLEASHVD